MVPRTGKWIVGLALAGCAWASPPPDVAPALACREINGLEQVLTAQAVLLIGELHGTRESPAFVAELACAALARGMPVTVALEIPFQERARIAAFLASDGGEKARGALLVGPFWDGEFQDGRRSVAKLELLDRLRRWQRQGLAIEIALLDQEERTSGPERDARMAERLVAAARTAAGPVVALTGNLHARTIIGTPWDPSYALMGYLVKQALPGRAVIALDVASAGGTAWFCPAPEPESCGVQQVRTAPVAEEGLRVILGGRATELGYDGVYSLGGGLTASPPAIGQSAAADRG